MALVRWVQPVVRKRSRNLQNNTHQAVASGFEAPGLQYSGSCRLREASTGMKPRLRKRIVVLNKKTGGALSNKLRTRRSGHQITHDSDRGPSDLRVRRACAGRASLRLDRLRRDGVDAFFEIFQTLRRRS